MKNMTIIFMSLLLSLLGLGCQSASNYLHKTIMPKSQFIQTVELGLYKFRAGNYKEATKQFQKAINLYRTNEDRPLLSFSDMVLFDYYGEGYDKVFLHNYNALNYLLSGNLEDAKIETKNSNFIQQKIREEFYNEIEKFKNIKNNYGYILDSYEKLFKNVDMAHNPYQNPFAYYISSLLFEEDEEFDDALIDIEHALKYQKNSKLLNEKLKIYKSNKMRKKKVELFFDIGKSPIKLQNKILVKINKNKKEVLYLPTFKIYNTYVKKIILVDSNDNIIKESAILCDIDAIKINAFKKKLPSLINKFLKEAAKEILVQDVAQKSSIANGIFKTIHTIYSQNNLYTWKTLPKKIEIISFTPKENKSYYIKIIGKNGKIIDKTKLTIKFSRKLKNCYKYYTIQEGRFYKISSESELKRNK